PVGWCTRTPITPLRRGRLPRLGARPSSESPPHGRGHAVLEWNNRHVGVARVAAGAPDTAEQVRRQPGGHPHPAAHITDELQGMIGLARGVRAGAVDLPVRVVDPGLVTGEPEVDAGAQRASPYRAEDQAGRAEGAARAGFATRLLPGAGAFAAQHRCWLTAGA